MTKDRIRVLIAIDQTIVRRGLATLLMSNDDLILVGEVNNGTEALALCETAQPQCILMDLLMADMDGIEATTAIHKRYPEIHVIIMTNWTEYDLVQRALAAGAVSYLLKNVNPTDLVDTIKSIYEAQNKELVTPVKFGVVLTPRELTVLTQMSYGLTNDQIAVQLVISRGTVKYHVSNILSKMDVSSRTEAVALAIQLHLIIGPKYSSKYNDYQDTTEGLEE